MTDHIIAFTTDHLIDCKWLINLKLLHSLKCFKRQAPCLRGIKRSRAHWQGHLYASQIFLFVKRQIQKPFNATNLRSTWSCNKSWESWGFLLPREHGKPKGHSIGRCVFFSNHHFLKDQKIIEVGSKTSW